VYHKLGGECYPIFIVDSMYIGKVLLFQAYDEITMICLSERPFVRSVDVLPVANKIEYLFNKNVFLLFD
jgi:hypothetical protein